MADTKKAIEEMTEAIPYDIIRYDQKPKGQHLYWEQRKEIAVALINANYGHIPQALTEFANWLIEMMDSYCNDNKTMEEVIKECLTAYLKELMPNANLS